MYNVTVTVCPRSPVVLVIKCIYTFCHIRFFVYNIAKLLTQFVRIVYNACFKFFKCYIKQSFIFIGWNNLWRTAREHTRHKYNACCYTKHQHNCNRYKEDFFTLLFRFLFCCTDIFIHTLLLKRNGICHIWIFFVCCLFRCWLNNLFRLCCRLWVFNIRIITYPCSATCAEHSVIIHRRTAF